MLQKTCVNQQAMGFYSQDFPRLLNKVIKMDQAWDPESRRLATSTGGSAGF